MATVQINQNKKTYTTYHNVNNKNNYTILLTECIKCKLQYFGKTKTELNIRINNSRKDVSK